MNYLPENGKISQIKNSLLIGESQKRINRCILFENYFNTPPEELNKQLSEESHPIKTWDFVLTCRINYVNGSLSLSGKSFNWWAITLGGSPTFSFYFVIVDTPKGWMKTEIKENEMGATYHLDALRLLHANLF